MEPNDLDRRQFQKFAVAALSGLLAGATVGLTDDKKDEKKDPNKPLLLQEPHVCRGLNPTCKGEILGKKHDCAGQANFATIKEHKCKGMNDCVGTGGCGDNPGENKCKGMGDCAIPLSDDAWKKARKNFEAAMTKANKKFGAAPEKTKQ